MAENAGSALRQAPRADRGAIRLRVLSALVLAPVALSAVLVGSSWFVAVIAAAAGIMAWEWGRLIGRIRNRQDGALLVAIAAVPVLAAGFLSIPLGLALAVAGILLQIRAMPGANWGWACGGLTWIILPSIGYVWIRQLTPGGFADAAWLLVLVWSVDTAAYIVGKSVGGPKLAAAISPNKTWSGFAGGVVAASLLGGLVGWSARTDDPLFMAMLSGGLAVTEQLGDIAESYAKRRFGAKDASGLIPGHGGLLDRLDGMLAVIAAFILIDLATGGNMVRWH
jgi:phosphatidate cytidylyltransferase